MVDELVARLPFRAPFEGGALLAWLAARAVPGVEEVDGALYRRSLGLPHGPGVVELVMGADSVSGRLWLEDERDVVPAEQLCRRLLDLDADPPVVAGHLGSDALLGPLVRAAPGLRVPGSVDGAELAVRAVLGQQVSVAGARTLATRLVHAIGAPLRTPVGSLTHAFPTPGSIAELDPAQLAMPESRKRALRVLCAALDSGRLVIDAGADRERMAAQMLALPGIGPWTVAYVSMRALGDPDVFLPTDIGVRNGLQRLGLDGSPRAALEASQRWRPWRSYALHHLWRNLG